MASRRGFYLPEIDIDSDGTKTAGREGIGDLATTAAKIKDDAVRRGATLEVTESPLQNRCAEMRVPRLAVYRPSCENAAWYGIPAHEPRAPEIVARGRRRSTDVAASDMVTNVTGLRLNFARANPA